VERGPSAIHRHNPSLCSAVPEGHAVVVVVVTRGGYSRVTHAASKDAAINTLSFLIMMVPPV